MLFFGLFVIAILGGVIASMYTVEEELARNDELTTELNVTRWENAELRKTVDRQQILLQAKNDKI